MRDELPHSLAVVIEEVTPAKDARRAGRTDRRTRSSTSNGPARRASSSARGARLKEVGTAARTQIEKLLGTRVYLDLRVKIAKNWQRDPKQLGRLGFGPAPTRF